MSTISQKRAAIETIAAAIHTGSPNSSEIGKAVKLLISGKFQTVNAPAVTYNFTHTDHDEYLRLTGLTGATTINLAADADLQVGATLTVEVVQGGTGRNVVLGTGITGDDLTGVANDVDVLVFKYVSTGAWVCISNYKTVNAA